MWLNGTTQCSGDDSSPSSPGEGLATFRIQPVWTKRHHPRHVIPTAAKRSGGIHPSSENNLRKVKSATWEDPSTPFHFGRDDISVGIPFFLHRLYLRRCMAMNHRRYIAWFHSTIQVVFETWRAASTHVSLDIVAAPTGWYRFVRTGCVRNAPGTAHRPFPTVSLMGVFLNQRISKAEMFVVQ